MLPKSHNLNISTFSQTISNRYLMNSYKLYWLAGIIEEIKTGKDIITFKRLVCRMVAKSWYSLLKFKLNFGIQDRLYVLVQFIYKISGLKDTATPENIIAFIKESKNEELDRKIRHFFDFVPNRLLSPFYVEELKLIPERHRNNFLIQQSQDNPRFYKIIDEKIIILPEWFDYIYQNQLIIEGWLNLKLISFLQKRNPNVPAIVEKINPPQSRNLSSAIKFWKGMCSEQLVKNIYSNEKIILSDFTIDHFIPWSFVLHDRLWNLIPVSRSINSCKSDRIPDWNLYFNNFSELQYFAFDTALKKGISRKLIEDYLYLNGVDLTKGFPKNKFIQSLQETIKPLHQLALNQGFQLWKN